MSILKILHYPDPRLRQKAAPVSEFTPELAQLIDDMFETMYDAPGIGLAANQVGDPRRFAVLDVSETKDQPMVMVNPQIVLTEDEILMDEGCLSVPEQFDKVKRFNRIRYTGLERDGTAFERDAEGLHAQAVQHEIDHLDGKLFIDQLSGLKRQRIKKKLEKAAKVG